MNELEWFKRVASEVDELKTRLPYSVYDRARVNRVIKSIHEGDETAREHLFLSTGLNQSVCEFISERQRHFSSTVEYESSFDVVGPVVEQRVVYVDGAPTGTYLLSIDLKLRETPYVLHVFLYSPEVVVESLLDGKKLTEVSCPATLYGHGLYIERVECQYGPTGTKVFLKDSHSLEEFLDEYDTANRSIIEVETEGILTSPEVPYYQHRQRLTDDSLILEDYRNSKVRNELTKSLYDKVHSVARYSPLETSLQVLQTNISDFKKSLQEYDKAIEHLNEAIAAADYCRVDSSATQRELDRVRQQQQESHTSYQKYLQKVAIEVLKDSEDSFLRTLPPTIPPPTYHIDETAAQAIQEYRDRFELQRRELAAAALARCERELQEHTERSLDSISIDITEMAELCRHRLVYQMKPVELFLRDSISLLQRPVDAKTLYLITCQALDYSDSYQVAHADSLRELRVRILLMFSDTIPDTLPPADTYPAAIRLFQKLTDYRPHPETIPADDYVQKLRQDLTPEGFTFQLSEILSYRPDALTEPVEDELARLLERLRTVYSIYAATRKNLYVKQLADIWTTTCRQLQAHTFTCTKKMTYAEFYQVLSRALETAHVDEVYTCDITELCNDMDIMTLLKLSQLLTRLEVTRLKNRIEDLKRTLGQ